jgi:hypothetical protein
MRRTLTALGQLITDHFMQQVLLDFDPKNRFREIDLTHCLPLGVKDVNIHQRVSACAYRGCLLLARTHTMPPLGPGTAPLINNKF